MRWSRSELAGACGQGCIHGALPQGFQLPVSHPRPAPPPLSQLACFWELRATAFCTWGLREGWGASQTEAPAGLSPSPQLMPLSQSRKPRLMVEGHATWREEATAHLTPRRLDTGAPTAHLGAPDEGQPVPAPAQPLLCRSPAWGAPGPDGPVLARAAAAPGSGVFAPQAPLPQMS